MAAFAYKVILEPEADGGFNVVIPAFPHAHTCGDTVEESLAHAREVIELELEVMHERGEEIPAPDGDAEVRVERVEVTAPAA